MPPHDPGFAGQPRAPKQRYCSLCRWQVGIHCEAPAVYYAVRQQPVVELVTGKPAEEWRTQRYESLTEHRSASWFKARADRLCGREGRWYETDHKKLTPPWGRSGVKPPPSRDD